MFRSACFALLLAALPAWAEPPKIVASPGPKISMPAAGTPIGLDPGKFIWLDLAGYTGPVTWSFTAEGIVEFPDGTGEVWGGHKQGEAKAAWHKAPSKTAVPCLGVSPGTVTISAWGVVDAKAKKLADLTIDVGPRPPPPEPKPPDPKPPEPKPVTSFRVFLIYESGATYPQAAVNVLYGNVVESWLTANCTDGKAGWRRRDRSLGGENDPTFAAMWNAIQPKLTTHPAVAVEVNGAVEIIPLEATPAAMVAKLETYRKGAK
jgi:hypothetical protein